MMIEKTGKMHYVKKLFAMAVFCMVISSSVFSQSQVEVFVSEFTQHDLRIMMEENASALFTEVNDAFSSGRVLELDDRIVLNRFHNPLLEMWENTPFYIPEDRIIEDAARLTNGYYEMRNIPVYFVDPDGEEHYEEAVLQFSPSGMISEFRVGLATHRYQELMRQGLDDIDRNNRQEILTFVENFRTSYNRKDLDFIESVFSDQALIIVGRVLQSTGERSAYADQVEEQVEFLQFSKDEYIDRLRHLFNINEWIDVGFEEIEIVRHPRFEEIYGVQLTQYYNSSIYSDVGFLFLLIDFQKQDEPMIHVRTWQPQRDTPEMQRFSIGDLEIL